MLFYPYTKLDASAILFLQKWRFQNSNLEKLFIVKHMGISWKFIPVMRAGLFTRDYFIPPMQDFISFKRDCGMAHFSYEHILFFQKLHRDSEDLVRQTSLVWRVSSSPYEQPQGRHMNASCVLNLGFASTEKELEDLIFGYFWQSVPFWKSTLHVSSSSSYPQVLLQMLDHRKVLGVQLWFVRCYRYSRVICLNKVLEHPFCRFLCAF